MKKILLFVAALGMSAVVYAGSPESVEGATTVDTAAAKALHIQGATFVDSRGKGAYKNGHVPGAKHLDSKKMEESGLSAIVGKTDPVVFYCSGIECGRAASASSDAISWGWTSVSYFREGMPGWEDAGHSVEN